MLNIDKQTEIPGVFLVFFLHRVVHVQVSDEGAAYAGRPVDVFDDTF